MYESNLVYAAWQEGPTTRPINKEQWRGSGGHSTEDRGRNKGTGKGERDGGRRETRGEDMITPWENKSDYWIRECFEIE